ncbi:hypothetical protein IFM89_027928 [Coptis chinensis]|uniref:Uncharacterized protein n=1 Tax=Coptis chinensis TaxID=261450 RepID=A0A835IF35_9MAGN|nr:hypothetical protein IFM89_027928 [Coptis chinensis]
MDMASNCFGDFLELNDMVSWNTLISGVGQCVDRDFENVFSVSSLIVGYSSVGTWLRQRRLFDSLKEKNSHLFGRLCSLGMLDCGIVMRYLNFSWISTQTKYKFPDALILINVLGGCAIWRHYIPKAIHTYMVIMGIKLMRDRK